MILFAILAIFIKIFFQSVSEKTRIKSMKEFKYPKASGIIKYRAKNLTNFFMTEFS